MLVVYNIQVLCVINMQLKNNKLNEELWTENTWK